MQKGAEVSEGDTISTALNSSAQIRMQDGGFIAVRPDTKLKFDSFKLAAKAGEPESSYYSLFKGGFRAVTGAIGRVNKKDYRITTAAATIGIRGTDHETIYLPNNLPGALAGAYSKVNVGETSLTTDKGTVNVLPNQMGYAGGMNQLPQIQPINTNIFTVSAAPSPTKVGKDGKSEDKQETGAKDQKPDSIRSTAAADDSKSLSGGNAESIADSVSTDNLNLTGQTLLPVKAYNDTTTLDATNQTITAGGAVTAFQGSGSLARAYTANHVAVETAGGLNFNSGGSGMLVNPADLVYVPGGSSTSGALSSMTFHDLGGGAGWTQTATISGGTATSANAPAGIQYGVWTGYTGMSNTWSMQLGGMNKSSQSDWMYGTQGYLDASNLVQGSPFVGTTAGTFTYQMDGANAPHSMNSGLYGTVTSASFTVSFSTMLLSGSLAITMPGNDIWGASITNQLITAGPAGTSSMFSTGTGPGQTAGSALTVSHGVGAAGCATCGGNVSGAFTGQNFAGAILAYSLYDNAPLTGGDVSGNVGFSRIGVVNNPLVTNGTPAATGNLMIATGSGSIFLNPVASTTINAGNVLTGYSSGTAGNGSSTTVTCPTCTATATGQVATSGIYYGSWSSGSITQSYSSTFTAGMMQPSYWITGPEAGPMYLPQALTGTAAFTFSAGQVSNGMGTAGTVLGTTALALDFNKQTVGINLNVSVPDTLGNPHAWNATTLAGNEAVLGNGQGISGAAFRASTFNNGGGSGLLTMTVDGSAANVTNANGYINGQLTGSGLTGAIISFNLNGGLGTVAPTFETISGVAAFTSAGSNIATPHRYVSIAFYEPFAPIQQPLLGFYANADSPATPNVGAKMDANGNLIQFDNQFVSNNNGGGSSMTFANNTATPALLKDHGTDTATGISWGRWEGGTFNAINRQTGVTTLVTSTGSLHWITEPVATSATTLPISGSYTYSYAGGTKPTDNLGSIGNLNSATLAANFTAQTVNLGVNATVAGATLNATGTNVPIIQNTVFYASSQEPATSTSYLTVSCSGACGATSGGTVLGKFTGAGAIGAAMSYGLQNGSSTISGVAAFHR